MTQQPEALGWATHHEPPMLFPTREEALAYCDEDEEPIELCDAAELRRLHEENKRLKTEIKTEQALSFRTQVHTLEAALRQAVEALEDAKTFTGAWPAGSAAITAAKQALEGKV